MKELNDKEIRLAVNKIKSKYEEIIRKFNKGRSLIDAFEERYMRALKNRMNISVFLLAEIEAVEELYKKEEAKKELENIAKSQKSNNIPKENFADKVYNENLKKIAKYPRIHLRNDTDEEIERLLGAVRDLINHYWHALVIIYKEKRFSNESDAIQEYYHKLLANYDYTGDFPIAKRYVDALKRKPTDLKKLDYEHRYILQETAFLLNDIAKTLNDVIQMESIPNPDKKLDIKQVTLKSDSWFYEYFKNLTHKQSVEKVLKYVNEVIDDFRFRGIKRYK